MGLPVLILGESGSGKTTSLRNFAPGEVGIISVINKALPFRSSLKTYPLNTKAKQLNKDRYALLTDVLKSSKTKTMIIDDSQYLINFEEAHGKIPGLECDTDGAKARSKTFPGIAKAMAEQWAGQA